MSILPPFKILLFYVFRVVFLALFSYRNSIVVLEFFWVCFLHFQVESQSRPILIILNPLSIVFAEWPSCHFSESGHFTNIRCFFEPSFFAWSKSNVVLESFLVCFWHL